MMIDKTVSAVIGRTENKVTISTPYKVNGKMWREVVVTSKDVGGELIHSQTHTRPDSEAQTIFQVHAKRIQGRG